VPASVLETRAKKLRGLSRSPAQNKVCGRNMHRADNGSGVAQDLRAHPILAVGAVQITAQHAEAVSQCSW